MRSVALQKLCGNAKLGVIPSTAASCCCLCLRAGVPSLQGTALASLQTFFQTLVASKAKSASFEALLSALLAAGHDKQVGKTAQHNIAQCIAMLCTAAGPSQTSTTVKSLLSAVEGNDEVASRLALFSLGEIGRCTDLSKFKQLQVCLSFIVRPVVQSSVIVDSSLHLSCIYII